MPRLSFLAALCTALSVAQAQTTAQPHAQPRPTTQPKQTTQAKPTAQPQATPVSSFTLDALNFLLGTWVAKPSASFANSSPTGTYTFSRDLANHVLERTTSADTCTGARPADCHHHDQLTIFSDPSSPHGGGLFALYLDSEGHVIYYVVTTPDPQTVLFQSQSAPGAPHFRLIYHLEGTGPTAVLAGSFQGTAPGSGSYHPYLDWSGPRQ